MSTPRFADAPAMHLVGIRRIHQFADIARDIGTQWAEFSAQTAPLASPSSSVYGVIGGVDMTAQWMDYLCGIEVPSFGDAPADLDRMLVPASHYAVFDHTGHISELNGTWRVAMQWLNTNGAWHDAHTPPFERYDARYDAATGLGGCEIWLPVVDTIDQTDG
jgi:AraC family transcriptional regulator